MKQRDVRAFLWDIERACGIIQGIVAEKTVDDYLNDVVMRLAVERAFELIGEALRNVLEQRPELEARITDASEIIAFRNRLAHGYWRIVARAVWGIIEDDLPVLRREVGALLAELPSPEEPDDSPA